MRGTEGSVDLMTIDLISSYNLMKSLCKKQNDVRCRGVHVAEHVEVLEEWHAWREQATTCPSRLPYYLTL